VFAVVACWLYQLGSFLSQRLPLRVSYALADILADIQFWVRLRHRRALLSNLKVVAGQSLGRRERRRLARVIFRNFGRSIVDFLRLPAMDPAALRREISAEGLKILDTARTSGRGAVLLTCHIGGWELGGAYLSVLGYPLNAVALGHGSRAVTEFFTRSRERAGVRVVGTREPRETFTRALQRGECLALLGDWDAWGRGTWVEFFGRRTRVPSAYVTLAAQTGGPILPGVVVRRPGGGYHVRLDRPIEPTLGDEIGALKGCLRVLERYISENLTQWFAFNPIWPEEAAEGRTEP